MIVFSLIIVGCRSEGSEIDLSPSIGSVITTLTPQAVIDLPAGEVDLTPSVQFAMDPIVETEMIPILADSSTPEPNPTLTPEPPLNPVGHNGQWTLLFRDEFEGGELNIDKWTTCYWWGNGGCTISSNNELEWYQPENVIVRDGKLTLRSQDNSIQGSDGNNYPYTSGVVTTGRDTSELSDRPRFSFQYGYAEIRAKIPFGQGLWPAFWLLPDNNTSKPEIDVLEILGHEPNTIKMRLHYMDADGSENVPGTAWVGPDFSIDWHTFAIDWRPDVLIWYVDGVERWRFEEAKHIPQQPMYLLVNLAVGGISPGPPDDLTKFPSDFEIDYLRVWRRAGDIYLQPVEDAYVDSSSPSTNYGMDDVLYSDGDPEKRAYLKFNTMDVKCNTLSSAILQIRTLSGDGAESPHLHRVRLIADSSWQEDTITFENQPPLSNLILGQISDLLTDTVYEIPLDISRLQPVIGTEFTLVIDSNGSDGLYLYARESETSSPLVKLNLALAGCDPFDGK